MGLDMYAYTMRAEFVGEQQTDVKIESDADSKAAQVRDIAYWRKFNHLHGWMERLYRQHGGTGDFNCDHVRLDLEDLDRLWEDAPTLPPAEGFFFGSVEEMTEEEVKEVRDFVEKARDAIKSGQVVIYSSWW